MKDDYQLEEFFRDYRLEGTICTPLDENRVVSFGNGIEIVPPAESEFEIEVYKYDPNQKRFVGSGNDNRGLSSIVGNISPISNNSSRVLFVQTFDFGLMFDFIGKLEKKGDHVLVWGTYRNSSGSLVDYPFYLESYLKKETYSDKDFSERDLLSNLVLPRKE